MLPNPFDRKLTEFKDTDPLKNREIVRELLGEGGVHKYRKILGENSDAPSRGQKDISKEELLTLAEEARSKIDSLSRDVARPIIEKLIEKGYASQIKSLQEINFLETKDGKLGLTAIDNNFYEVPSAEAIKNHFLSIPNIRQKIEQGFTRLLIVPFGSSLDLIRKKTSDLIIAHDLKGGLKNRAGRKLEISKLGAVSPHGEWDEGAVSSSLLIYLPPTFQESGFEDLIIGTTKLDLLDYTKSSPPFPGYHICLIQEDPTIPNINEGVTKGGRPELEVGKSPNAYLKEITTNPIYKGEHGLSPEDWLTLFATNLNQKNEAMGDYPANYLIGAYFIYASMVPMAVLTLDGVQLTQVEPSGRESYDSCSGVITAVT